jgi:hypothetical protein
VAVRIASRIDQTPIQEVKRILKRHLNETNIHKDILQKIISRLGEEPTDAKSRFVIIIRFYYDGD